MSKCETVCAVPWYYQVLLPAVEKAKEKSQNNTRTSKTFDMQRYIWRTSCGGSQLNVLGSILRMVDNRQGYAMELEADRLDAPFR
jgi:SUMO ligase MMS21 Smc5/6 complex component